YSFFSNSDDGSSVFIDGVMVLNNDGSAANLSSAPVNLSAGQHDIRIDFVQATSAGAETLSYSGPSTGDFSPLTPGDGRYRVIPMNSTIAGLRQAEVNTAERS